MEINQIKKAIKDFRNNIQDITKCKAKSIHIFLTLAQQVVDVEMPKEKIIQDEEPSGSNGLTTPILDMEARIYNQALNDCRLFQAKQMGGIETKITPYIQHLFKWECIPPTYDIPHEIKSIATIITQAITEHFKKE